MDLRMQIRNAKVGDSILMEVVRQQKMVKINVSVLSYQQPVVHIAQISKKNEKQQKLYDKWVLGK